jgi:signal transduction histidine kinase
MKLAAKLVSILVFGMLIILAVDSYFTARRDIEIFETDMKQDAHLLGRAMKGPITDIWLTRGQERALKIISEFNEGESILHVRWVWLNAPPDDPYGPSISREKLGMVMQGQEGTFEKRYKNSAGYLYTYVPMEVDEKKPGALELSESLLRLDAFNRLSLIRTTIRMGELSLVAGLAALLLGFGMIGRPLQRLIGKVHRVAQGDLSGPLVFRGRDEFSELAVAVNAMCRQLDESQKKVLNETAARITAVEQLRHADRLRTIGELASGIAHELGTPLNVVSGRASLIATGSLSEAEIVESATIIKAQSERMTTTIRHFLSFARRRSSQKSSVDLRQIVHKTLDLMAPLGHKQKAILNFTGDDNPARTMVDAEQIQQVLTNLIVNALQAMPQGGTVEVGICREYTRPPGALEGSDGEYLSVYVRDEGEGIAETNLQHIFEPFFTTKDIGKGTGLGLSIAYGIVQEHGGWIDVKSKKGKGSCFFVYLPLEVEV